MKREFLTVLTLLLTFSSCFAFTELVQNNFSTIVSVVLFLITFSLIFPVLSNFTDNQGANIVIALSLAGIFSLFTFTNAQFNTLVYNFLFAVPYGLLVLVGLVIVVNLLFNKNDNVKWITSFILIVLFVFLLFSGVTSTPSTGGGGDGLVSSSSIFLILIVLVIFFILVGLFARNLVGRGRKGKGRVRNWFRKRFGRGGSDVEEEDEDEESISDKITELKKDITDDDKLNWFNKLWNALGVNGFGDDELGYYFLVDYVQLCKSLFGMEEVYVNNFINIFNSIGRFRRKSKRKGLLRFYWKVVLGVHHVLNEAPNSVNSWDDFKKFNERLSNHVDDIIDLFGGVSV